MHVELRPWQPEDRLAAWSVLREASFSNVWPSFLIALRRPATLLLCLVAMTASVALETGVVGWIVCPACCVCGVYCACLGATLYFLYGPNFQDMKNVQEVYFSHPDHHFWVAKVEGDIVGTIAVVRKPTDSQAGVCVQRKLTDSQPDVYVERKPIRLDTVLRRKLASNLAHNRTELNPKIAWLRRMAVRKGFRGQGIAKRLVQVVIDFCKEQNYNSIFLITTEVHQPARRLYTHLGFKQKAFIPYKYLGGLFSVWTYEFEMPLTTSTDQFEMPSMT